MLAPPPLPRTLEASLRDLSSTKAVTRASAVKDLARHASRDEDTRVRSLPLFERALKDEAPGVRAAAAVALADVKGVETLAALLTAVEDVDAYVRQMALNALGEIGDARAAARLKRALRDERPEVRYQALIAFSKVGDAEDVLEALLTGTRDDDPAIRYIALRLAEDRRIASADGGKELLSEPALDARAKSMLDDTSREVAVVAAIYLARTGDAEARELVLDVVRGKVPTPEPEDEQEAVELAGELDLREAIGDLERRAWGLRTFFSRNTCAWNAKIALARMRHPRAMAEILADIGAAKEDIRTAAVVAAGRARLAEAKEPITALPPGAVDADLARDALSKL